uniref:Uncharacterized protein n=1 Tax=Firmicutes phage HS08 TaxID=3056391 RepID=A0AA49X4V1_9VIRU|nr:MAG: hypothetical protein [Firmicutes phage HS08]
MSLMLHKPNCDKPNIINYIHKPNHINQILTI